MRAVLEKHEETYRRVWDEGRKLVRYLRQADAPIPEVLRITAKYVLEEELVAELEACPRCGRAPRAGLRGVRGGALPGARAGLGRGPPHHQADGGARPGRAGRAGDGGA